MYSWIPTLTLQLPPAVKMRADNKHCHRVNGEVQTQVYANTALLIVSVRVHYADERGIKIKKNKPEICTSYASRAPQHGTNSWIQLGYDFMISFCCAAALGGTRRGKVDPTTQASQLSFTELITYLSILQHWIHPPQARFHYMPTCVRYESILKLSYVEELLSCWFSPASFHQRYKLQSHVS